MTTATRPLDLVLGHFPDAKKVGREWVVKCPCHADSSPSLHIRLGEDGRVLLKDFGGCPNEAIVKELGLTMADLFEPDERRGRFVVAETDYRVCDEAGQLQGIHRRIDYSDGSKDVIWRTPEGRNGLGGRKLETMPLYGSEHLATRPHEPVIVCEGEKAAQALLDAGYLAVGTVTGAGSAPSVAALAVLSGRDVILWPDNDPPGRAHMNRIAHTLAKLREV